MYRFRTTCNVIYTVDYAQHAKEFEDFAQHAMEYTDFAQHAMYCNI